MSKRTEREATYRTIRGWAVIVHPNSRADSGFVEGFTYKEEARNRARAIRRMWQQDGKAVTVIVRPVLDDMYFDYMNRDD